VSHPRVNPDTYFNLLGINDIVEITYLNINGKEEALVGQIKKIFRDEQRYDIPLAQQNLHRKIELFINNPPNYEHKTVTVNLDTLPITNFKIILKGDQIINYDQYAQIYPVGGRRRRRKSYRKRKSYKRRKSYRKRR
jgi:hypothetical protein